MKHINGFFFLSLILVIFIYWLLSVVINKEIILPKIPQIISCLQTIKPSEFFRNIGATIAKTLISYFLALILGLLASFAGYWKGLSRILNPYVSVIKSLPVISVIIIILIWAGKEFAIYIIAVLVIFPPFYEMFLHQIVNTDKSLNEVCMVYRFSVWKKFRYLYFYQILEGLMLSMKQTLGLCFKVVVTSEVIIQTRYGIGAAIQKERINLDTAGVFAWTLILIVMVVLLDYGINRLSKFIIKWK